MTLRAKRAHILAQNIINNFFKADSTSNVPRADIWNFFFWEGGLDKFRLWPDKYFFFFFKPVVLISFAAVQSCIHALM